MKRIFDGATSLDLLEGEGWAWVGLDSTDGLHRLHSETLLALDRLFTELRFKGARRVALGASGWMTGQGRHFSAGADLHEVAALRPETADAFARRGQRVMRALQWPGWRTLTLMSGVAMGGGCDLALHGQERWAVANLKMAHPAAKHGILTGFGGTVRLPGLLGAANAARLFAALEHWNAEDARAAGAVQRILESGEVREAVLQWLKAPAVNPTSSSPA
ncbi:MAG: enoyl-CoA hydratase/isomerase family protein [Acidobacteria bacterium]|nr:enoyl-CoA hydratase/isomerase family protein [Acidobacteriota bacterium]